MFEIREKRKLKRKQMNLKGIVYYISFSIPYILFMMYIYGMAEHYYPDPIEFLPGQYISISLGVILLGTLLFIIISSIFTYYIIKKLKK